MKHQIKQNLCLCMRKQQFGFPTRFDTNWPVQSQKLVRRLKFRIKEEEGLYYLYSKNKDADQLCSYCTADRCLFFFFCICRLLVFGYVGSNIKMSLLKVILEASVVQWLCHSPCKPRVAGLIPGFSSQLDGTINRGPVSI